MAILYTKSRKNEPEPTKGFDLVLTDNTTYNLDDLGKDKDRSNPDAELALRVIDNREISKSLLSDIMSHLKTTISDVISNEEVQNNVSKIINGIVANYGLTDLNQVPDAIYVLLNKEVNEYLLSVFDAYGISYKVKFFDATRADIEYTISDNNTLQQLTQERLNYYLTKYKNELNDVKEGSLAISNIGKRKSVGTEDYKKYLLSEEFGKEKTNQGYVPNVTNRRPIVMWEEGSPDTSDDGEEPIDVYESIKNLEDAVFNNGLTVFETADMDIPLDTGMENNIAEIDGFQLIEKKTLLL